jgi:hypothetical protein
MYFIAIVHVVANRDLKEYQDYKDLKGCKECQAFKGSWDLKGFKEFLGCKGLKAIQAKIATAQELGVFMRTFSRRNLKRWQPIQWLQQMQSCLIQ